MNVPFQFYRLFVSNYTISKEKSEKKREKRGGKISKNTGRKRERGQQVQRSIYKTS